MSGICIGLQWLVYFWCGEDNCWVCFSLFFPLFSFFFVCLVVPELLVGVQLCHVLVLLLNPIFPKYHQGGKCLPRTPRGVFSTPLECSCWKGLSFHGNLGEILGQAGPSRLVGAAPPLEFSSGAGLCRRQIFLGIGLIGAALCRFSMVNLRSSMVGHSWLLN